MSRSLFRPLAAFGILAIVTLVVGAQAPPAITPADEKTAKMVVALLERNHMAKPVVDNATAEKWVRAFLKDLDPQKYYFLRSDISEFLPQAATIDDKIHEGNIDFAREVFARFLQRNDERLAMVLETVKQKPDFNLDESMADDPEFFDYPKDDDEARDRVRKRVKLELLQSKIDDEKADEALRKLVIRYRDRNRLYNQFKSQDILELYLTSLSKTFDPHTSYMNKESWDDFLQSMQLSLTGIGASLASEDGFAVVKELIPGGPADKDGRIQPEDKILGIQKEDGTEVDFVEKRLKDVVKQIRGDAGTHARLIVQPNDTKDKKIYDIVRQKVEMTEQHAKGQVIETEVQGKMTRIGVISLPAFYGDTQAALKGDPDAVSCTNDCRKIIDGFKAKNVECIMMDLRSNGGGLLNEAVSLSGLFIDKGPIVQVRKSSGVDQLDDEDAGTSWDGPMVVLIDRLSASASEIFAGAIKDYGRGLIIGDSSTYGKGTVQQVVQLSDRLFRNNDDMGALKLTIQQFYRVNGDSTQIRGVVPDIHIPSLFDQSDFGEGKMDNAMKFDHVAARPHDQFNKVPAPLVAQLEARSEKRRAESEKFQKRDAAIKKLIDRKSRHAISLNEAKFRAELVSEEENKDEAKTKKKEPRKRLTDRPVWESNYYNDEVVKIIGDYLNFGHTVFAAAPVRAEAAN